MNLVKVECLLCGGYNAKEELEFKTAIASHH